MTSTGLRTGRRFAGVALGSVDPECRPGRPAHVRGGLLPRRRPGPLRAVPAMDSRHFWYRRAGRETARRPDGEPADAFGAGRPWPACTGPRCPCEETVPRQGPGGRGQRGPRRAQRDLYVLVSCGADVPWDFLDWLGVETELAPISTPLPHAPHVVGVALVVVAGHGAIVEIHAPR